MIKSPTILLGLGGIGSQVVEKIYSWIPHDSRDQVLVHAFDTNVNDISRLQALRRSVTQISAPWTVGQYLDRADPSVRDWFPDDIRELHRKNLTEGAGQVRCISRLAYRAAIDNNRLAPLTQQIAGILSAAADNEITSIRVMVVSSLAGGTGAGVFLQVALYVRELLETAFNRQNVIVRGAFLLPDILVGPGVIKDSLQVPNVRSNGYACLKELDAITRVASGANGKSSDSVTIELEYRPRQVDLEGRLDHAITDRHLPYDWCFLFDYENTAGQNLGSFPTYLEQVARAVHAQLFSPMAPNHFSQEDNQILELVLHHGTSRYCGAGVARLVYPYDDILDYCALRWATDSLTTEWLKPDQDFSEELRAYERDLADGINREPPDCRERFLFAVDNYSSGQSAPPLFKAIRRSTHIVGEKGEVGRPKAQAFLDSLEAEIDRLCNSDEEINALTADCQLDETRLKDRDHTSSEVDRQEQALERLRDRIMRFVDESRTFLSNRAVVHDCDRQDLGGIEDYRLNSWLFSRPDPLHPLAVRYVLYQLDLLIDRRLRGISVDSFGDRVGALEGENERRLRNIKQYSDAYDVTDAEGIVESAHDRVRQALGQPFLARLIKTNLFDEFVDEYIEKSSRQLSELTAYKRSRLTEHVLSDVQRAVKALQTQWERYFRNLRDVRNRLRADVELLAEKHDQSGDPTTVYVFAGKEEKLATWDDLRRKYLATSLPVDVYRQMLTGQFRRFCSARHAEQTGLEPDERVEAMFRKDVVAWCREQLRKEDSLDRDIVSALKADALRAQADPEAWMSDKLRGLDNLARPWAPAQTRQAPIEFWGIHPDSLRRLGADATLYLSGQLVENPAYSRHEIVRYRAQYGMKAEDFAKFSRGGGTQLPGAYFRAYLDRVRALNEYPDRTVTPHLDRRWHLPAYLPDLNASVEKEDRIRIERAFLLGLIYRDLKAVSEDGRAIWLFRSGSQTSLIKVRGRDVIGRLPDLLEALSHNPAVVNKILDRATERLQQDLDSYPHDVDLHGFKVGCLQEPNILERLLTYPTQTIHDEGASHQTSVLLGRLFEEISRYLRTAYGSREHAANEATRTLIQRLMSESPAWQQAQNAPDRAFEELRGVADGFLGDRGR